MPPLAGEKSSAVAPCVTTLIEPSVKLLDTRTVAVFVALVVPTGSANVPAVVTTMEIAVTAEILPVAVSVAVTEAV